MKIIKPPALKLRDTIAVVSPASPAESIRFDNAVKKLKELGYNAVEGAHSRTKLNYFAGGDIHRAEDFNRALNSPDIKAVFSSRGGYGCSRILPMIDSSALSAHPKIITGGSDLTALLWALHQRTGLVTFFAPMALEIGEGLDTFSAELFWRAMRGELAGEVVFPADYEPVKIHRGKAKGCLIGGCLSLVVTLLGTEYFGDIDGKILFLEDIGEKPFRIDRMLTHLRNAGVFNRIAGLLLGDFYHCWDDSDDVFSLEEIIDQVLGDSEIPIMANLPFGHGKQKMTLPLGVEVEMDADEKKLIFLEEGEL